MWNRSTSARPAKGTIRCGICTAFGSPLVPEVKIIMNVSVGTTSRYGVSGPALSSSAAQDSLDTSTTCTPGRSRPSSRSRCAGSVSRI